MPQKISDDDHGFAIVSTEEANSSPYPYVLVTETGAVHELDAIDQEFLETKFHPCDGGRPFVKSKYEQKNGWGNLRGFCSRWEIPAHIPVVAQPVFRGLPRSAVEMLKEESEKAGYTFVQNLDGTFTSSPQKQS